MRATPEIDVVLDRPMSELAWNYVDLDVTTLLSFERPPLCGGLLADSGPRAP